MFRALVATFVFLPLWLQGQSGTAIANSDSRLHYYFTLYSQTDGKLAPPFTELDKFLERTEAKRTSFSSDKAFVRYLFAKTHHEFFLRYQEDASFRDLMSNGIYNCLTGTALLGLLLEHHGIQYKIVETNYHVFLLVDQGSILLETTDMNGFVDDPKVIEECIAKYQRLSVEKKQASKMYYEYPTSNLGSVSSTGMLGLLHYNQSVKYYNEQKFELAVSHLRHALLLHRSEKMLVFLELMIETIQQRQSFDNHSTWLQRLEALRSPAGIRSAETPANPN